MMESLYSELDWISFLQLSFWFLLFILCFKFAITRIYRYLWKIDLYGKFIVISGCDSGFGRALTERLVQRGAIVFAGCYLESSIQDLSSNLCIPYLLDVTDPQSVSAFYAHVEETLKATNKTIYALVNNAGIIGGSYFDLTPVKTYEEVMDVNYFGVVRLTKAFLPLLKKSKGRLIIMSSFSRYACFPQWSAYIASKFAVEAFADCFRREIQIFGVDVILLQPGLFSTEGLQLKSLLNNNQKVWDQTSEKKQKEYGNEWRKWWLQELIRIGNTLISTKNVDIVVDAYENALSHPSPQTRYVVGPSIILYAQSFIPTFILDRLWFAIQRYFKPPTRVSHKEKDLYDVQKGLEPMEYPQFTSFEG